MQMQMLGRGDGLLQVEEATYTRSYCELYEPKQWYGEFPVPTSTRHNVFSDPNLDNSVIDATVVLAREVIHGTDKGGQVMTMLQSMDKKDGGRKCTKHRHTYGTGVGYVHQDNSA